MAGIDPGKIAEARKAGISDKDITDFLADSDPRVKEARDQGVPDKDTLDHLSTMGVSEPKQNLYDKYGYGAIFNPEARSKMAEALPGYLAHIAKGLITGTKQTLAVPGEAMQAGMEGNVPPVDQMVQPATNLAMLMAGSRGSSAPQVGRYAAKVAAPTEEALKASRDADYQAVRDSGSQVPHDAVAPKTQTALDEMGKAGTLETSPTSTGVLKKLGARPAEAPGYTFSKGPDGLLVRDEKPRPTVPITDILDAQQALAKPIQGENPAGRAIALKHLHSILEDIPPDQLMGGTMTPGEANALIKRASGNSKALYNSQIFTNAEARAENNALSVGSGNNPAASLRQQMKSLIQPRLTGPSPYVRTMSPELEAATKKSLAGSKFGNANRSLGNLFGGGGGIGRLFAGEVGGDLAHEITGLPGAHIAGFAAGVGLGKLGRSIDNFMVRRSMTQLGELARSQSPIGIQSGALATNKTHSAMHRVLANEALRRYMNSLNTSDASP